MLSSGDTDAAPLGLLLAGSKRPSATKVGSISRLGACLPDGLNTASATGGHGKSEDADGSSLSGCGKADGANESVLSCC